MSDDALPRAAAARVVVPSSIIIPAAATKAFDNNNNNKSCIPTVSSPRATRKRRERQQSLVDEDELRAFEDDFGDHTLETRHLGRDTHEETRTTTRTRTTANTTTTNSVRTVVANTEREDTSAAYHELLRSDLQLPTGGGEEGNLGAVTGESGNTHHASGGTDGTPSDTPPHNSYTTGRR